MAVGKPVQREDGVAKVTGKARYTDDFTLPGMRVAKYLRSTVAHGRVVRIDTGQARGLPGVDGIFTYEDIPKKIFATAGHPFSLDPGHTDVADRRLLTNHIRYQGDEIAVVVAENELTAQKALALIEHTDAQRETIGEILEQLENRHYAKLDYDDRLSSEHLDNYIDSLGEVHQIRGVMQTGKQYGMVLLEESLVRLAKEGRISEEDALSRAEDKKMVQRGLAQL